MWAWAAAVLLVFALALVLALGPLLCMDGWIDTAEQEDFLVRLTVLARQVGEQGGHPRWIPELAGGHGYPLYNFYGPGAMYMALPFIWLGIGATGALKCVVVLAFVLGGAGLFLVGMRLGGRAVGLAAVGLGLVNPVVLYDVYWLGNVSQLVAYCAAAVVLWAIVELAQRPTVGRALVAAVAYGGFSTIHAIMTLAFTPVFLVIGVVLLARSGAPVRVWALAAGAALLGGTLSAWYLVPALGEKGLVQSEVIQQIRFHRYWENFSENPLWVPVGLPYSDYALGVPLLVALGGAVVALVRRRLEDGGWVVGVLVGLGGLCTVMSLPVSLPVYGAVPLLAYVNVPARWLGPAVLLLSVAGGFGVRALPTKAVLRWLVVGAFGLLFVDLVPDARLFEPVAPGWEDLAGRDEVVGFGEYLPRSARRGLEPGGPLAAVPEEAGSVVVESMRGVALSAVVEVSAPTRMTLRQLSFPGWVVFVDGRVRPYETGPDGRMEVALEEGEHLVVARFDDTTIRAVAGWISVGAWGGVGVCTLWLLVLGGLRRSRRTAGD